MKKFVPILTIIVVASFVFFLIFIGYRKMNEIPRIKNGKNITKITVTLLNERDSTKSTESKNEITDIVNYINGMNLKKSTKDGGECVGAYYVINVYTNHKIFKLNYTTKKKYLHVGNLFFKEKGKKGWYDIPLHQEKDFDIIFKSLRNN